MKAIVADDSQVMRMIIEKIVKTLGYQAIHAGNGQEVLSVLEKGFKDIDLILLDWNMPVMNGLETLTRIKKIDPDCDIPILMVSTESEDDKVRQAMHAGAGGYISKPFTAETLGAVIRQVKEKRSV
ncbi:MAG: response regulator [Deltaproteobacteria bacterium HGW-Deltaproteobacteria-15]|jgi:two-component system chemotaxis response regulator CheY|nr:MAG: response regulator [Deltaproteobacteria bacterium HGW-Deltaproteobacteria-15]